MITRVKPGRLRRRTAAAALCCTAAACAACATTPGGPAPRLPALASTARPTGAPAGADTLAGVEWLRIPGPAGRTLTAAVVRPAGSGPHPVVVLLHGTHGFAREYLALARELAREAGVVAVPACWFAPGRGAGVAFVAPIDCPDAPSMPDSSNTPEALAIVSALVDAARTLLGVRPDRVVLFGHSRGGVAALYYALERGRVPNGLRAVVLNATAYPPSLLARAPELQVPTLMLHGTADSPAQGGSPMTTIARARAFEAALRAARKVVDVRYFEGADHNTLFIDANQRTESVRRMTTFLRGLGIE
jgi:dienelactone hydrolase